MSYGRNEEEHKACKLLRLRVTVLILVNKSIAYPISTDPETADRYTHLSLWQEENAVSEKEIIRVGVFGLKYISNLGNI